MLNCDPDRRDRIRKKSGYFPIPMRPVRYSERLSLAPPERPFDRWGVAGSNGLVTFRPAGRGVERQLSDPVNAYSPPLSELSGLGKADTQR